MKENKYQEALNYLDWNCNVEHKEQQDLLQELVDRETPWKVIKVAENKYSCRRCSMAFELKTSISNMFVNNQYCDVCGHKLDWSDEE